MTVSALSQNETWVADNAVPNGASKAAEKSFDQFMTEVEKRGEKPEATRDTKKNEVKEKEVREKETKAGPEPEEIREDKPEPERKTDETGEKTKETAEPEKAESTETKPAVTPETEAKIVSQVAELLGVPVEMVMQWLATLNLQPVDLVEPQAVVQLLQQAFDAPTPAALLTKPEFKEAFEAIKVLVEDIVKPAEPVDFATKLPELNGLRVETDKETGEAVVTNQQTATTATETVKVVTEEQPSLFTEDEVELALPDAEPAADTAKPAQQQPSSQTAQPVSEKAGLQNENPQSEAQLTQQNDIFSPPPVQAESAANANARPAEAAPTAMSASNPVDAVDVMSQIMSRVRTQSGDHFAEIRITLRPENLGDVTLRVVTQNGIVSAQFVAENQRIKEVLESNFNQLRDALQEQGVNVAELYVSVNQNDNDDRMNQFLRAQQNANARRQRIVDRVQAAEDFAEEAGVTAQPDMLAGRMDVIA
ncbi:MAG: flagellar hook-length control protein FliK [Clostridiales bacterium]|nr:flagellar hook-length control protein FliK [Clostridiales bacterium]